MSERDQECVGKSKTQDGNHHPRNFPDFDEVYDKSNKQFWITRLVCIQRIDASASNWMEQVKVSIQNMLKDAKETAARGR